MPNPQIVQARYRRRADAILQEQEGIKRAVDRLLEDVAQRRANLAAHRADIQADPDYDTAQKTELDSAVTSVEADLAAQIDQAYATLSGA